MRLITLSVLHSLWLKSWPLNYLLLFNQIKTHFNCIFKWSAFKIGFRSCFEESFSSFLSVNLTNFCRIKKLKQNKDFIFSRISKNFVVQFKLLIGIQKRCFAIVNIMMEWQVHILERFCRQGWVKLDHLLLNWELKIIILDVLNYLQNQN